MSGVVEYLGRAEMNCTISHAHKILAPDGRVIIAYGSYPLFAGSLLATCWLGQVIHYRSAQWVTRQMTPAGFTKPVKGWCTTDLPHQYILGREGGTQDISVRPAANTAGDVRDLVADG